MTVGMVVQLAMDGLLLSLCGFGLLGRGRGRQDGLYPLMLTGICLVARRGLGRSESDLAYAILPVDSLIFFLFLFLAMLLLHSVWFPIGEGHTFFGTAAVFAQYLLLRTLGLTLLYLCGAREDVWYLYAGRALSLLFWLALWAVGAQRWLREQLAEGDVPVRIVCCNTALILVLVLCIFQFDLSSLLRRFSVLAGGVVLLVLGNGAVILAEQHRIQMRRRAQLLEQYLPLVEELVEQVRARQHAFQNRMMAVRAALETAQDLQEAQQKVSVLLQSEGLDGADRELLKCDSQIISGMLFGKTKQAEMRHIRLCVALTGTFLHRTLSEADWVEVIGILIDNAVEASKPGDVLYVEAAEEPDGLRLTVSNPYRALSQVEFVQMFRRGWSTKAEHGRGYGLYNIRRLVERYSGKLITRNQVLQGVPYLTIGVLFP